MIQASIILPTHNMEEHVKTALIAILAQTESNFELIIIDDASTDKTQEIIANIKDPRIIYIRNSRNLGKSLTRNKGIKLAKSKYLFFTDADCKVDKNWLKEGLQTFKKNDCVGVEGKIYYVSKKYQPTYSDRVVQNLSGSQYMTANMAYKKDVVMKVNMFDQRFKRNQDRDLALKIKKIGNIIFNKKMLVTHTISLWTPLDYFISVNWIYYQIVLLYKIHHEKNQMFWRIYEPKKLIAIFFPFIILLKLFIDGYKSKNDYILFLLCYPRIVYERFLLWKYCLQEKVFII